jgi:hypothetical protein
MGKRMASGDEPVKWRPWRREPRQNREDEFPDEVLELRERRGIPLPTWFIGPLFPSNHSGQARKNFEQFAEKRVADTASAATIDPDSVED